MHTSWLIAVLIVLMLFSAFFSASEAALIALNKVRLRHSIEKNKRGAKRIYGFISRMDKLIATLLIGNNLVNTAIASVSTYILTQMFGAEQGLVIATIVVTIALVTFGDLIPKVMATKHPEHISFWGRHIISFLIFILSPITSLLTAVSNGFIKLFGGNPHYRSPLVTEEEIKMMITIGKEEGFYGDNERKMLERIFHFDEIEVEDVMTPIEKIIAVPVGIDVEELERILLEEGHNRIPVYKEDKTNIVGIIYVRDILYLFKNSSLIRLEDLMSAPYFVTPTVRVAELLKEFQRRKIQIAIVQSTDRKTIGLVTLEDLLEEIVGEIEEIDTTLKN